MGERCYESLNEEKFQSLPFIERSNKKTQRTGKVSFAGSSSQKYFFAP